MKKSGKVIQSTGKWYKVSSDGEIFDCRIPGKFRLVEESVTNPVAVGDNVDFTVGDDGSGMIDSIHDRKNYVPRKSTRSNKDEQILVANIDRAWVVQSIRQPKIKRGFIDRFLVACEAYEIPSGIIINKTDLANKRDLNEIHSITDTYTEIGYPVLQTSLEDDSSIEKLREELQNRTSVFIGHSGVGKTSLINVLDPSLNLAVGDISSYSDKGKHTTTYARLLSLNENSYLVDTPGIKEFGLVNIEPYELSIFFPEMHEARLHCKFNNCTHNHEPKCGVIEAFERGEIDPDRYDSYLNMLESIN
ncbi:ribosome small subunit-dependent GTPase A [Rhodohalobacter sp. SW132]|uniref:ribosome small subunit-dependent GTPase A n=1 Tax=Rhodohalobacter sp. SW132 TaxID=2293433 RepID=UPI000E227DB5|nr:ribosome small subunit-dependent GTPase A [Rhodohalobacter sp. SW132]REL33698.1 ribosome small subunit-dependent GTPase A [Rhodohalobacter sp. SW132]